MHVYYLHPESVRRSARVRRIGTAVTSIGTEAVAWVLWRHRPEYAAFHAAGRLIMHNNDLVHGYNVLASSLTLAPVLLAMDNHHGCPHTTPHTRHLRPAGCISLQPC